jgi:hypothetical protein
MSPNCQSKSASARKDAPSVMMMLARLVVLPRKPTATTASMLDATAATITESTMAIARGM